MLNANLPITFELILVKLICKEMLTQVTAPSLLLVLKNEWELDEKQMLK
jgi:hypothetical protein